MGETPAGEELYNRDSGQGGSLETVNDSHDPHSRGSDQSNYAPGNDYNMPDERDDNVSRGSNASNYDKGRGRRGSNLSDYAQAAFDSFEPELETSGASYYPDHKPQCKEEKEKIDALNKKGRKPQIYTKDHTEDKRPDFFPKRNKSDSSESLLADAHSNPMVKMNDRTTPVIPPINTSEETSFNRNNSHKTSVSATSDYAEGIPDQKAKNVVGEESDGEVSAKEDDPLTKSDEVNNPQPSEDNESQDQILEADSSSSDDEGGYHHREIVTLEFDEDSDE